MERTATRKKLNWCNRVNLLSNIWLSLSHNLWYDLPQLAKARAKTYNSGYLLVVTHIATNPPVSYLNRAERTRSLTISCSNGRMALDLTVYSNLALVKRHGIRYIHANYKFSCIGAGYGIYADYGYLVWVGNFYFLIRFITFTFIFSISCLFHKTSFSYYFYFLMITSLCSFNLTINSCRSTFCSSRKFGRWIFSISSSLWISFNSFVSVRFGNISLAIWFYMEFST